MSNVKGLVNKIIEGTDVHSVLSESTTLSTDFEQSIYSGLKSALADWIDYIGDEAQWMRFVSKIAHLVWDDLNK